VEDDLHLYRRGDERHQVEAELDGCCLVVEELDGHLAQCELLVLTVQQAPLVLTVQQAPLVLTVQQAPLVLAAQQEQQVLQVLAAQQE
jgi:hypothetical protein